MSRYLKVLCIVILILFLFFLIGIKRTLPAEIQIGKSNVSNIDIEIELPIVSRGFLEGRVSPTYNYSNQIIKHSTYLNTIIVSNESENPLEILEKIKYYANKYNVDYDLMVKVLNCESGLRHTGVYGDSGKAYGIAQFHRPTFEGNKDLDGDYFSLEDQLNTMAKMWSIGKESHWTCWRKLK